MYRRFGEDTELLASMVQFTHVAWETKLQRVSTAFNLDWKQLDRISDYKKALPPYWQTCSGKKVDERLLQFWQNLCADPYTKQMYPEHSNFAALMLTMPIGSCSVERCFSYTTSIGVDDKRQSLTEKHIQQLMRISQQAPPFPSSSCLTWPFTVSAKTPDSFINDTFEEWLQAPRRLLPQKWVDTGKELLRKELLGSELFVWEQIYL